MAGADQNPAVAGTQTVQIVENTQHSGTTAFARGTSSGVTVVRAPTSITTTASGAVSLGGQLTDTAVVSGRVSPQPGATVDFRLYGPIMVIYYAQVTGSFTAAASLLALKKLSSAAFEVPMAM